ncbi:uncharacterized protein E5676_scaffold1607G001000 [Cucumis melo var. makuwa]|uniref:Uncharacterized protein n=1 Tax=Cucumis melo var. makuwa TaxID=1194695 RepID=A0A5A7UUQ4_CUCMM|nr:uncharacterized protein E6C27_scaffold98G00020 [Cucumis melo var. makuwa]TYK23775.1 uncharacterized protein E5676_scaffold1607G001000 [Cucumis melo var. makuwa]
MVRRSIRCLGSRLNKIKSNKDDPIVIDDNTKGAPLILKMSQWSRVQKLNIYARLNFQYKAMFEDDFVEPSTFHERIMGEETHETFERGECSQQPKSSNEEIPYYFLNFQELIMANDQCLNQILDKLIEDVECLKNMFKEKNDLLDDVVYNTALLNEVDKIEKEAIKMKSYQQAVRKSMRRGNLPSRILRLPYTMKFGSVEPKKEKK